MNLLSLFREHSVSSCQFWCFLANANQALSLAVSTGPIMESVFNRTLWKYVAGGHFVGLCSSTHSCCWFNALLRPCPALLKQHLLVSHPYSWDCAEGHGKTYGRAMLQELAYLSNLNSLQVLSHPTSSDMDTSDSFCCLVVASPVRLLSVGFEPKQVKRIHHSFWFCVPFVYLNSVLIYHNYVR